MARPVSIRDEDLLEAARAVFLEKGVRATTSEVAARAGVSEGILFKRFGSKEELFRAAMHLGEMLESVMQLATAPQAGMSIEAWLEVLGLRMIELFRVVVPVALMSWSNHVTGGELPKEFQCAVPPPVRGVRLLTAALEREMRAGRLRRTNAEIVARNFLGSLWHFVFLDHVLRAGAHLPMREHEYVKGSVDFMMNGLKTDEARKRASAQKSAHTPSPPRDALKRRPRGN